MDQASQHQDHRQTPIIATGTAQQLGVVQRLPTAELVQHISLDRLSTLKNPEFTFLNETGEQFMSKIS